MDILKFPRWSKFLIICLLFIDLGYSFNQHLHKAIGGDIAQIVVPNPQKGYYQVLQDPLGYSALIQKQKYSNPNRFFAHWTSAGYLRTVPLLLQKFVDPINSIYLANALAKWIMQLILIFGIAFMIVGKLSGSFFKLLFYAFLISPLIQINGYHQFMGLIDDSIIYAFFYALPMGLLLILFYPFTNYWMHGKRPGKVKGYIFFLYLLSVFLSLNGPLVPGVILVILFICFLYFLYLISKKKIMISRMIHTARLIFPGYLLGLAIWMGLWSLYSLYLGSFNDLNDLDPISLADRYSKLPLGIVEIVTTKIAFPVLFIILATFLVLVQKYFKFTKRIEIFRIVQFFVAFCIVYILLLPLGGYRDYRPGIVRYDTIIPVTMAIMIIFSYLAKHLLEFAFKRTRKVLLPVLLSYFVIFSNADRIDQKKYFCEKEKLEKIAATNDQVVRLDADCPVMEFRIITDPEDTWLKSDLLLLWNIIDEEKIYFQSASEE